MKSYTERHVFGPEAVVLWECACRAVASVTTEMATEPNWSHPELRCHELTRAVVKALGLSPGVVVDGKYGPVEHSWIWLPHSTPAILDVYCPGRIPQVQLVHGILQVVPHPYRAGDRPRSDIDTRRVDALSEYMLAAFRAAKGWR